MGMKNESKEVVEPIKPLEEAEEEPPKQSLKSVRGQPKKQIPAPDTGVDSEPKSAQKVIISIWKCRECGFLNKLGDSSDCGNTKKCNYNL